jgi:hypothetical protein
VKVFFEYTSFIKVFGTYSSSVISVSKLMALLYGDMLSWIKTRINFVDFVPRMLVCSKLLSGPAGPFEMLSDYL